MSHFAKIEDGKVVRVIRAEQDVVNDLGGKWIQVSYNTSGGVHAQGGVPLRKNYPSVGDTYDEVRDAIIPPKPHDNFILDEASCLWIPPIPKPTDGKAYGWDDKTDAWVELPKLEEYRV